LKTTTPTKKGSTVVLIVGPEQCHWISKQRMQLGSNAGFRSAGSLGEGTQAVSHPCTSVVPAQRHQRAQQAQAADSLAPATVHLLISFSPQMLQFLHSLFMRPRTGPKLLGDILHSKRQSLKNHFVLSF